VFFPFAPFALLSTVEVLVSDFADFSDFPDAFGLPPATCLGVVFAGLSDLLPEGLATFAVEPFEPDTLTVPGLVVPLFGVCTLVVVGFPAVGRFDVGLAASLVETAIAIASATKNVSRRILPSIPSLVCNRHAPGYRFVSVML